MTNSVVVTDKARHFRWIGLIKVLFPNTVIIHCKRDPLENSWSIYKNVTGYAFQNVRNCLLQYLSDLMYFGRVF